MKRDGFIFYGSFYQAIAELPDADRLAIYDAIARYGLTGEMPELSGVPKAMMVLIQPLIDANQRRYENGCKGGRGSKSVFDENLNETKAEPKPNQTQTEIEPSVNQSETKTEPKYKYKDKLKENSSSDDDEQKKTPSSSLSPEIFSAEIDGDFPEPRVNDPDRDAQKAPPPTPSPGAAYGAADALAETALSQQTWAEAVCMNHGISREKLRERMDSFVLHLRCIGKERCGLSDFLRHFDSWLRTQKRIEQEKPPDPVCKVDRDLAAVEGALEQIRLRKMYKNQMQTHETEP